jgi:hypothetical protein
LNAKTKEGGEGLYRRYACTSGLKHLRLVIRYLQDIDISFFFPDGMSMSVRFLMTQPKKKGGCCHMQGNNHRVQIRWPVTLHVSPRPPPPPPPPPNLPQSPTCNSSFRSRTNPPHIIFAYPKYLKHLSENIFPPIGFTPSCSSQSLVFLHK